MLIQLRQAKTEIVSASKVAYRFLAGVTSNATTPVPDSPSNSNRGSPRFQATWFKNLIANGAKPSGSSDIDIESHEEGASATPGTRSRISANATESTA